MASTRPRAWGLGPLETIVGVGWGGGWYVLASCNAVSNGSNEQSVSILSGGTVVFEEQGVAGDPGDRNYTGSFLIKMKDGALLNLEIANTMEVEETAGDTIRVTGFSYYAGTAGSASFPPLSGGRKYVVAQGTTVPGGSDISQVTHATAVSEYSVVFIGEDPSVPRETYTTTITGADGIPSGSISRTTDFNFETGNYDIVSDSSSYSFPFDVTFLTGSLPVAWPVSIDFFVWPVKGHIVYPADPSAPIRKKDDLITSPFEYYQWDFSLDRDAHDEFGFSISGNDMLDGTYEFVLENNLYLTTDQTKKLPQLYTKVFKYTATGWDGATLVYFLPDDEWIGTPPRIDPF